MPKHRLADVQSAVAQGQFGLGRARCLDFLLEKAELFDTPKQCKAFVRDVVLALTAGDFGGSRRIPHPTTGILEDFDIYGVKLAPAVLRRHRLSKESTWYVKITLRHGPDVFCLSVHDLEEAMRRPSGVLFPAWKPDPKAS